MKRLPLFLALACGVLPVLQAEEGASVDRIREGEAKQQQLRGEAQRLVEQLDSMMDEYKRNQLGGEEIKTLQGLRDSLAKLSVDEMKQVVDLLEKARGARDAGEAKQRVADAYTSQKAILAQMAKLLADHLRNEQSQEFAQQLAKLAERQAVNLQNGITLGQWSGGKKPDNLEAAMEANLQGQQAEQSAISDELKTLTQRVAEFSKDPENADQAHRLQKGLSAMQKVQPNVDSAAAALKASQLFKAVGDEKTARDTMRQVAREIAPPPERAEVLRAAQKELAKAIEDQKDLAKDAAKTVGEKDLDHWLDEQQKLSPKLAKMPREQQRKDATLQKRFEAQKNRQPDGEQLAEMEKKQGELAARTDEMAQSLAKAAPEAARDVKAGTDKMQEARGALADKNIPSAMKNGQDALAAMQAADAKLQQEMAKAEALAGKSGDPVKDLQALQQQAQALAQQQAAAAKNPDKAGQAALAQKAGDLAKQAAAMAPAAAPAAQQAAAQAQQAAAQAQQAMAQAQKAAQAAQAGQPAAAAQAQQAAGQAQQAAAQAQQAAAQNLAQAAQQIAQQAAQAQQAQQQAAAAQQAQQQLAEIIFAEQKLQIDTTKSAAAPPKGKTVKRDAFNGQAGRQEDIDGQTAAFQKGLPQPDPATKTALEAAQSAMSDAKKALEKLDGETAKTAEAKAVEQLFAAQTGMQAAAAQAQQQMAQAQQQAAAQAQQQMAQQPNAQANAAAAPQAAAQQAAAQQAAQQAAAQQAAAQQAAAQQAAAQQAAAQQAAAQQAAAQLAQAQAQIAQANQALQQAAQAPQPAAAQKAAQQAAADLAKAAAQAGQAAAQAMPANAQAQQAIQAGAQAAAQGAAQAAAQNVPGAQAQAAAAGQALAQAQAALAQAQAGLTAANTPGAMPGQPSGQPGQPGQPSQPGQKPGQQPGQTPGKPGQMPGQPGTEAAQQYTPPGSETAKLEARTIMDKKTAFAALPARERAVIEQSQSEKYPEEYGAQVEQYLLNLARESATKK